MHLVLDNHDQFDIVLDQGPVSQVIEKTFKHLQHVPIPFREWDNPFFLSTQAHESLVNRLVYFARRLNVNIDSDLCLRQDQKYLNHLHEIYEKSYDGDPDWLDYHEHIHLCEKSETKYDFKKLVINYREKAGPLERKFDPLFRQSFKNKVTAGEVYVSWAELGKTPYHYWKNNEPDDIDRICELAKPWLILRPKLNIAFSDIDFMVNKKSDSFDQWWEQHHDSWCRYWNIDRWSIYDMFSVTSVGHITEINSLANCLTNGHNPEWIKL